MLGFRAIGELAVGELPSTSTAANILNAGSAAYVVAGQEAASAAGRLLSAQDAAYIMSVTPADVYAGRLLSGQNTSFTLSGAASDLLVERSLSGQATSVLLDATGASLQKGHTILAASGIAVLAGQVASLVHTTVGSYVLAADNGVYTVTPQDASLLLTRILGGNNGTFACSGVNAGMLRGLTLPAEARAYILTGADANLVYTGGYSIVCGAATYALSAQDASLLIGRIMNGASQGFILDGGSATFVSGVAEEVMIGDIQWRISVLGSSNSFVVERPDNNIMIN